MKIVVKQGIIHINSVSVLQASDTGIYLSADCKQKYPELLCLSDRSVMIGANERTLNVHDRSFSPTEIIVEDLEGKWCMVCEIGRYSVEILLVKLAEEGTLDHLHWRDDE